MVSAGDYDPTVTDLCERMLVTVIGRTWLSMPPPSRLAHDD